MFLLLFVLFALRVFWLEKTASKTRCQWSQWGRYSSLHIQGITRIRVVLNLNHIVTWYPQITHLSIYLRQPVSRLHRMYGVGARVSRWRSFYSGLRAPVRLLFLSSVTIKSLLLFITEWILNAPLNTDSYAAVGKIYIYLRIALARRTPPPWRSYYFLSLVTVSLPPGTEGEAIDKIM